MAKHRAHRAEQRGIRGGVELGKHALVRVRPTLRIHAESHIENRRVGREARAAAQDLRKGQFVGPDERQPFVKALELVFELPTPESSNGSGPRHHEHLLRPGKQLQDVVDRLRKVVGDGDGGFILPKGRVAQDTAFDGREHEGYVGKELLSILAREDRRRSSDRHDELGLGTIGEGGSDVVDNRLFGCADEPGRTDDDLDDVHRSADALVEVHPEVGGEGVDDDAAAIDPLQQQDLLHVRMGDGLSLARRRREQHQTS